MIDIDTLVPVSYTPLDVYKRQAWAQATYVKEKSLIEYLGLMAKD